MNTPTIGGCAPFAVTYTAPAGATGHSWDFGNGTSSTNAFGAFNYVTPGVYTITYSGTSGGSPVTFTTVATVLAKPAASFVIGQSASVFCAVKTVTLTDNSTGSSINQWVWTYGDGGSNTFPTGGNHTYGYTIPGNFSVTLQVYNIYGCTDQITVGSVSVTPSPTAVISSNPSQLFSCTPPFTPAFSGSSSQGLNLAYSWNFGNGQPASNAMNPGNVTYSSQGNYTVSLTVTSAGCSNTATRVVVVNPTTVTATLPSTICLNAPYTLTLQSNAAVTTWSLGNGNVVNLPAGINPSTLSLIAAYSAPGVYTMTIGAGFPPCQSVITRTVFVEQVIANFVSTPPATSCSSPFLVTYSSTSTPNATQFDWIYPTWQKDTLQVNNLGPTPTFTFYQNSLNPYVIYESFAPTYTMIAISAAGCRDTVWHTLDSITRPTAFFYKDRQEGCIPLVVNLIDSSFVYPFNPVTSYTWCNGDNPPVFVTGAGSVIANQTFTYNTVGTFFPYLIIQTANGCLDVSFTETVITVVPPVISFSVSPTGSICPTTTVQIVNTTALPTLTNVTHWHVDSDNGFFSGCVSDPNPKWNFTHIGPHSFTMTGYEHSCPGTYVVPQAVFIKGPIVQSRFTTNCINRLVVDFNSQLQGVESATLSFGDASPSFVITGDPDNTIASLVTHTYAATGDYTVTLTGINSLSGCAPSIYTMQVQVRNVQASISSPSVSCIGVSTPFDASASIDVFKSCSRGYVWYVDNFPPVDKDTASHGPVFMSVGIHTVTLKVKDINSCTSTATTSVRISSVSPGFTINTNSICVNGTVQVTNTTSQLPDPVNVFSWNFGDSPAVVSGPNPGPHTYNFAVTPYLNYNISLTVTNTVGCTQTIQKTVTVMKPDASVYATQYSVCVGPTTVTFVATGNNSSYTLNLGGNNTVVSTSSIITYPFVNAGVYAVNLTAQDANGCYANGNSLMITAQETPTANFSILAPGSTDPNSNVICAPTASVTFIDSSQPAQTYTYSWNLGTPNPVIPSATVVQSYNSTVTTVVLISHTVATSIGCTADITKTITIYSPKAKINLSKNSICLGDPVSLNISDSTGSGIMGWIWDFGDASGTGDTIIANTGPPATTVHAYTNYPPSGTASLSLIYYSDKFACKDVATATVRVIKVDADFNRNSESVRLDSVHCIRIPDNFSNTSPSPATSLSWNFGDGSTSTANNPTHTYQQAGVYQVSLTVTGEQSCKGLTTKNMTINPLPAAVIASEDSTCRDLPLVLTGTAISSVAIVSYDWMADTILNTIGNTNPYTATPTVSTHYLLVVTDANGCKSPPVSKFIYVQQPPPTIQWDTTVIVGQQIPINTGTGSNYTYTWTPPSDLSCLNCIYPVSTTTVNVVYNVDVMDNMSCFRVTNTYSVYIDPLTSVDVPTAFTPNGDGVNDVIYVDGWGIRKLNYFRIYNRWGQLLFETNDIKTGWDGFYNGVPQNMETYVYQVSVETYVDNKNMLKTSSFRLIR